MRATVVIPCWNEDPSNLVQAVTSAGGPGVQVIVVDDGSTRADTISCLELLDAQVVRTANRGPAAAMNTGCSLAEGKYLLTLGSDDWIGEGFIDALVAEMDRDPHVTIAYTAWHDFGARSETHEPPLEISPSEMVEACPIVATSLFRREDWATLGGFDEALRAGFEDWEWWVRLLLQRGGVGRMVPGPIFHYRIKASSRNITNSQGVGPKIETRRAMLVNNPDHVDTVAYGLLGDLYGAYELGQNQSPIAAAATAQARYWAQRYGKVEGALAKAKRILDALRHSRRD